MSDSDTEKKLQETYAWARSSVYEAYNTVLGRYQAESCLENCRGTSLLDAPCGDGTLTEMLSGAFNRIVGLDASSAHLAEARKRLPTAKFHEVLLEQFETSERFDTITMINVLEHLVDPVHALRRMASLLSDDGILIIHVPNAQAINRRLAVLMGTLESCEELSPFDIQVAGHRRSYSLTTLQQDIEAAGLKCESTGGIFYKMLSTPQMDWFLKNGPWEEGGFGWGRVGAEGTRDWKEAFCRASYELGKQHPEDCNVIFACVTR